MASLKSKEQKNRFDDIIYTKDRSLFIVIGYMRSNRANFLSDLLKIITAYYDCGDEWNDKYMGKNMEIVKGSNKTKIGKPLKPNAYASHESVFCQKVVSEGIHSWHIRVNKVYYPSNCWHIYVGVTNTKVNFESLKNTHPEQYCCYTFDTTNGRVANQRDTSQTFNTKVTKVGDIIRITLDLINRKLRCCINGEDIGVCIDCSQACIFLILSWNCYKKLLLYLR